MAGLFLVRSDDMRFASAAMTAARGAFAAQGFPEPVRHELPGWTLLWFSHIIGGPAGWLDRGDAQAAVAGTLTVDGRLGREALAALLTMDPLKLDWTRIGGQFAALVRRAGRTFLFGDYFSAFQLFGDTGGRVFSTSLLAATAALPKLSFDPQGVYELAFNVMPIGDDTVFAELKTLSPFAVAELTESGVVRHAVAKPLPDAPSGLPFAERIERAHARLAAAVGAHAGSFDGEICCPLSGGLDSRLVLAALREQGVRPHVYVYGNPGDPDVDIAIGIGAALGFPVEWFDKDEAQVAPDAFPELVSRNFHQFDGLPTFGNIFDNGSHAAGQLRRHAGGAMAVSGGCGEIYRNFFYLPDGRFTAADIAATFFARFDASDATAEFDARTFMAGVTAKIRAAIEPPAATGPLGRSRVEQIYPRIRCRALFGREISLEARFSPYLMPFLDHQVVGEAMTLPLGLKNAGRFEAVLLNAIDPELARQPSAYGHDFAGPPNLHHRFGEWQSRIRPVWLRRRTYALRRRFGTMGDEHGGLLTPDYMNRVIDPDFPIMRRFFAVDRIADYGLWRRIANLEYLAASLGSKLA
ncbi:asparagine synthase C-terminal domain-containing protein [Sphingomonas sp. MG17]|uniref:Asparagine synthase C-terminal domain-containing protein n=1 Tax=Sphingomonas tagetis TaxID=2949092 RepID=A0A9X2HH12_9SPHN|nr:asparagine synthase C-terminal domain-containing protein [Sphingomonas tagetis]MCP3730658.1 asparagine synthase C-terminal domain-containing protein [Sphingomonas tagetis]